MNERESPFRRRQNEIRSIFNKWLDILQLQEEQFPIKLRILSMNKSRELYNRGFIAHCIWNNIENLWGVFVPVDIKEVILIHELGHLFFPKQVNDMRLAPSKEKEGLNFEMMKCLNSLMDCFVNHYLSELK